MHLFYDITCFVFSNVQVSKSQTCRCQSHIAPASQRRNFSLCKCIKSQHWFWLPASYCSGYQPAMRGALPCCKCSRNHVTGPCGPSLVLATSQPCEQLFLALDVHGTHATATFSKRRLLLLLLLILITGINARAYELH